MGEEQSTVAVYDTKSYDREFLLSADGAKGLDWRFHEFRLNFDTAVTADGADVVVPFVNDRVDRACLEVLAGQGVKLVALRCAGFNNVDLDAAKELGIPVTRVPSYSPHAVAEHTVGLLLALNRRIHRAWNRVREQNFSLAGLVGFDVCGKTVGIIGTGKIGQITAEIFRGFQANVLAFDPFPNEEWAQRNGVTYGGLDQLLKESDIISLHTPLTKDTHHILDEETLSVMKRGVVIVNTSRGKLIDTRALIGALKSGHIGGVALDVYEEEEGVFFEDLSDRVLPDDDLSRLLSFPNVLVTSHQAFLTREALSEIARVTVANAVSVASGGAWLEGTHLNP